jgi:transcriptional regulator with XRE-family HTH domain
MTTTVARPPTMAAEKDPAFKDRLRELRTAAGVTQLDLAFRAHIQPSTVARLERGTVRPSWDTVVAMAKALGVGVEAFTEPPSKQIPPTGPGRPRKATPGNQTNRKGNRHG